MDNMKKWTRLVALTIAVVAALSSNLADARTLERNLTYPLMEEYCRDIERLAGYTAKLIFKEKLSEEDELYDKAFDYAAENIDWNGRLNDDIIIETIKKGVSQGRNMNVSGYKSWAYHNCNKRILFYKN